MPGRDGYARRAASNSRAQLAARAPLRMLMNNLDPEVAERPDDWSCTGERRARGAIVAEFDAMSRRCRACGPTDDVGAVGQAVGVLRTHEWAPRVLIANSNLVPEWATWEESAGSKRSASPCTARDGGSWIYIGTQGILQGTYECFPEIARRRFGGSLSETITLTAGPGAWEARNPSAVTMNVRRRALRRCRRDSRATTARNPLPRQVADSLDAR